MKEQIKRDIQELKEMDYTELYAYAQDRQWARNGGMFNAYKKALNNIGISYDTVKEQTMSAVKMRRNERLREQRKLERKKSVIKRFIKQYGGDNFYRLISGDDNEYIIIDKVILHHVQGDYRYSLTFKSAIRQFKNMLLNRYTDEISVFVDFTEIEEYKKFELAVERDKKIKQVIGRGSRSKLSDN